MAFAEVQWVLEGGLITPEEWVDTKHRSTLRYLEYVRQEITGSRRCAKPKEPHKMTSTADILEGPTIEAYAEVLEGWQLVPSRFF